MSVQIIGPANSRSRIKLQALCDGLRGDLRVVWGRDMDKLTQLKVIFDAGVRTPTIYSPPQQTHVSVRRFVDWGHVIWGRQLYHTQGLDIATDPSSRKWRDSDYWVEVVQDVKDEWRIHVMDGSVIHTARKFQSIKCVHSTDSEEERCNSCVIRSRGNGWRMTRDREPNTWLRILAKAAVAAIGWDLGAVDLIERTDGSGVVLEVNSRPGLDDRTAQDYFAGIQRRLTRR